MGYHLVLKTNSARAKANTNLWNIYRMQLRKLTLVTGNVFKSVLANKDLLKSKILQNPILLPLLPLFQPLHKLDCPIKNPANPKNPQNQLL